MESTLEKEWHFAKTGNHQGLIIDQDGRNVAISYDSKDAPLIAAAPELLEAAKNALQAIKYQASPEISSELKAKFLNEALEMLINAIAKTQGK